jgi:AraC-like DNA-binding protein
VLTHRIHPVAPPLTAYVEHLWMARGVLPAPWRNMIFPDGAIELMINLGDPQKLCHLTDRKQEVIFRRSWISGERGEPIVINESGYVHLVGIRLRPGGGWPVLGRPLSEFTGRVVELEAVFGREIDRLREQMGETRNDGERFALVESWLLTRMRAGTAPSPAVRYAVNAIRRGVEGLRIGQIAEETGLSHKHLLREFDRCVGLTPKMLARVCAFQRAIFWIGHKTDVDWADAAAACGYYDQAHFIHEFRAFSGLTPSRYLSRRGPYLNYLTVE